MANADLWAGRHGTPNENVWWYEEPSGIRVVHRHFASTGQRKTLMMLIRWPAIRAALCRKDKAAKKSKKKGA